MIKALSLGLALVPLLSCTSSNDHSDTVVVDADLVIVDTTAITMTDNGSRGNVDIFISGDKIVTIAETGTVTTSSSAQTISGTDRYVIPGLADMHVHIRHEDMLPVLAAHGVVLVRDMWGTEETLSFRDSVRAENQFAPSILVGSPGVDGNPPTFPSSPTVESPSDANSTIKSLIDDGYDFIKIYDRLSSESFAAVAEASRSYGIPFAGHPPFSVAFDQVLDSGIASIEHLQGYVFATARDDVGIGGKSIDPMQDFPKLVQAVVTAQQQGREISSVFDQAKRDAVVKRTATNGVWNTPTLIALLKTNTPSDERGGEFAREELAYLSPELADQWRPENNFRFQFIPDNMLRGLRLLGGESRRVVKSLQDVGAGLLLGTDTPEAFIIPGISVHEELQLFVESGLTPLQALATATSNVGLFLGQPDTIGVIADGARADLVLLAQDPVKDIQNSRTISGVVLRGRYFDRASINDTLDQIALRLKADP
jgi:hypothetical protein